MVKNHISVKWSKVGALGWMFISPHPNPYVEILPPRWWSWGQSLMEGILALISESREGSLTPSTVWGHSKELPSMNQGLGVHQILSLQANWSWICQPPELWEINFCCFCSVEVTILRYFVIAAWMDHDSSRYCLNRGGGGVGYKTDYILWLQFGERVR